MRPSYRRLALTVHVTCSVGWLGAVAAFLVLSVVGFTSREPLVVMAAYVAMEPLTWFVLVPLAIASLLTGLVSSLGSRWGLVRYHWVLAKLLLTVVAVAVLLLKVRPIGTVADAAATPVFSDDAFRQLRLSLLVHSIGGLFILLFTTALGVLKPWGLTCYGRQPRGRYGASLDQRTTGQALGTTSAPAFDPSPAIAWFRVRRPSKRTYMMVALFVFILLLITLHVVGGGARLH